MIATDFTAMTAVIPFGSSSLDPAAVRRAELVARIRRLAPQPGTYETGIPSLNFIRVDERGETLHVLHKPALCVILQGRKQVRLWHELYHYDALNYLVVSVTLPLSGEVIQASADEPYLCVRLDIDGAEIAGLLADIPKIEASASTGRGLFLDELDTPLLDALMRLVGLLETPEDIALLAPMALREIFYRVLRGRQGARLLEIAIPDSQTQRVSRAIEWLNNHYVEPLRIDELAQRVHLSPSTLHQRFKAVTAMSPLQYQKQLRLQEARRLLISEDSDVSSTSYRMGYESPSQFCREYSRLFGASPLKDVARLRAQVS
jgi:AraC-like DNA-binding protein